MTIDKIKPVMIDQDGANDGDALVWNSSNGQYEPTPGGAGSGDVVGPASSTDNAIARYNGTSGKIIQNSGVTIDDSANVSTTGDYTAFGGTAKEFGVGSEVFESLSTGVESFAGLSINATTSLFDVGAAEGHIVDLAAGTYDSINYAGSTGNTPATANGVSYVYITKAGALSISTTAPTAVSERDSIYLGRVVTISGTVVQVQDEPKVFLQPSNQLYDLMDAIRLFNVDGNILSANGVNLSFDKSAGELFSAGANFVTNSKKPHTIDIAATSPTTFAYITQLAGSTGANVTVVDPTQYDNAGTITAIGGSNNQATNQRVYLFPSGNIRVQYGQTVYSTLANAVQGISTENFTINPNIPDNGILLGIISVTKGCTDLSDTNEARILQASRFGQGAVGASGQSVSSLQDAYNNSVDPEILTDSTLGAVNIRRGSASDADNVLAVQNNAGTDNFAVTGEGNVTVAGTVDGRDVATDGTTLDTINANYITASSTTTLTNKTFDANGTGNSISNIDVADLANGTDGELITWDATGAPATVAAGTAGQVLTSNGAGAAPTFQAAGGGGGKIVQVVNAINDTTTTDFQSTSSGTFADVTSMSATITPTSSSNDILVVMECGIGGNATNGNLNLRVLRGATVIELLEDVSTVGSNPIGMPLSTTHLDSPATTSSTTYKLQFSGASGGGFVQRSSRMARKVFLMEVSA